MKTGAKNEMLLKSFYLKYHNTLVCFPFCYFCSLLYFLKKMSRRNDKICLSFHSNKFPKNKSVKISPR